MRKIPTLFVRDWDGDRRYVLDEVAPGCEWVTKGDGIATRKYDGTCVMFDGSAWSPDRIAAMFDRFRHRLPELLEQVRSLPDCPQRNALADLLDDVLRRIGSEGHTR